MLTHGHRSHLGGLAALKRLSGATVYAHDWEADIIAGERTAQPVTCARCDRSAPGGQPTTSARGQLSASATHPPCPDRPEPSADGDPIGPLEVLHAPGHSPGHLAFYWPERRALFAGDAIVTWPAFAPGWPAFTSTRASIGPRWAAWRRSTRVIAVGHGEPIVQDAAERLHSFARQV